MTNGLSVKMTVFGEGHFGGTKVREADIRGFRLSESTYSKGSALPMHSHPSAYFGLILSGCYQEHFGRSERACESGSLIYHPKGELHRQFFSRTSVRLFRVELADDKAQEVDVSMNDVPTLTTDFQTLNITRRLYREFRTRGAGHELVVEGLVYELMGFFVRQICRDALVSMREPDWISAVHQIINDGFAQPLTLESVGKTVGVHPITLARQLRTHRRQTFAEMLRQRRLNFAREQLINTAIPISEVALNAGFYDQSHFTKTFQAEIGIPPGKFRAEFLR